MNADKEDLMGEIQELKRRLKSAGKRAETWKKLARLLRDKIKEMESDFTVFKNKWLDCLVDCANYRTRQSAITDFFHFLQDVIPLTPEEWKKVEILRDGLLRQKIAEKKSKKGGVYSMTEEKCRQKAIENLDQGRDEMEAALQNAQKSPLTVPKIWAEIASIMKPEDRATAKGE